MKRSLLGLMLVGAAVVQTASAQTAAQIESDEVKRVGAHINCQCGACTENVNCNMSSGQCHFCKPTRTKIYQLQKSGMDDAGIVAYFKKQYGEIIFRAGPNSFFWIIPYLALLAGAVLLWFVLRRMMGKPGVGHPRLATAGAAPLDDPLLARYRDRIEKDTDRLE